MLNQIWNTLKLLLARLGRRGTVHYIAGTPSLPPPLTAEQEKLLLDRMGAGDRTARDDLITHNLRLVVYLSKKFETSGVPSEDIISIGTIGLIKAVNTFTPERKIKLATYASRCIGNEILMYLRKTSNRRQEASIDEPLNVDSDGNELLLSDVLGSDENQVGLRLEQDAERSTGSLPGNGRSWSCGSAWWTEWSGPKKKWPTPSASAKVISPGWKSGSFAICAASWKPSKDPGRMDLANAAHE